MSESMGIYLHIPFCVRKCRYCDFLSAPADSGTKHRYAMALCREIETYADRLAIAADDRPPVDSVFIGGGTPSTLEPDDLAMIMDRVYETFDVLPAAEITMEMNPGIYSEGLTAFAEKYLNRVSIGLQSARDAELRMLGRIHTFGEFENCFYRLREAGISNINVDLMSAIPGQTVKDLEETLGRVIALNPEHISAYSLIIEEGTPFYDLRERGELELPDEDTEREMYHRTKSLLAAAGYHRYEISNYAKAGYECRHNIRYWRREPYLGFGIGAASLYGKLIRTGAPEFSGQFRRTNGADLKAYLDCYLNEGDGGSRCLNEGDGGSRCRAEGERKTSRLDEGDGGSRCRAEGERRTSCRNEGDGENVTEKLSVKEAMEEFMFLGLRMTEGISGREFFNAFGLLPEAVYGPVISGLLTKGLLAEREGRFMLTERGIDVANTVMAEFLL